MTRDQKITKITDRTIWLLKHNDGDGSTQLNLLLRNGHQGFSGYSDQQLDDELIALGYDPETGDDL